MSHKLKFLPNFGFSIKFSDDRRSAWCNNTVDLKDNNWIFSENYWNFEDEFQFQIIQMVPNHSHTLQFGFIVENPETTLQAAAKNNNFKMYWLWKENTIIHKTEENFRTTEEYNFNLLNVKEGDLLGLVVYQGQLYFKYNGYRLNKVGDVVPLKVRVGVNLTGRVSFISLISSNTSISSFHFQRFSTQLQELQDKDVENESESNDKIVFHEQCGSEIELSNRNRTAKRKNPIYEFRNAVVVSSSPLPIDYGFRLKIDGIINKWNGSIEFGVTIHNPNESQLPATLTNLRIGTLVLSGNSILTNGHSSSTPYSSKSLDDLNIEDIVGVTRHSNGNIHFFLNGQDLGLAGNIDCNTDIWVIADLYGRTIKISISSPLSLSSLDNWNLELPEYMPSIPFIDADNPLRFHSNCGSNIILSKDMLIAKKKTNVNFNNGILFTNRPLVVGERFCVKLTKSISQWSGSLELGISNLAPDSLEFPLTITEITNGYNLILTSNGILVNGTSLTQTNQDNTGNYDDDADLVFNEISSIHPLLLNGISNFTVGSLIGLELLSTNELQFHFNGTDLGSLKLPNNLGDFYGVVDLYGKAGEVQICSEKDLFENLFVTSSNDILKDKNSISLNDADTYVDDDDADDDDDDNAINRNVENEEECGNYQNLMLPYEEGDNSERQRLRRHIGYMNEGDSILDSLFNADQSFLRLLSAEVDDDNNVNESDNNRLGSLVFHCLHGQNVLLSDDCRISKRPSPNNEFKNAIVMSSRCLDTNEMFEISIDNLIDEWSGSLEIGVTLSKPDELDFPPILSQFDKSCWILSGCSLLIDGIITRNDYELDMDKIATNNKIGIVRFANGNLHFYCNGKDMGLAFTDVPRGIYAIVDLYGQCSEISVTDKCGTYLSQSNSGSRISNNSDNSNTNQLKTIKQFIAVVNNRHNTNKDDASRGLNLLTNKIENNFTDNKNEYVKKLSLFHLPVLGNGLKWHEKDQYFSVHKIIQNCLLQTSVELERNSYYEMLFCHDNAKEHTTNTLSLAIISDKFQTEKYLPNDLFLFAAPIWIIYEANLYINGKLEMQNFAPDMLRLNKFLSIGIHVLENRDIILYVNNKYVALLNLNIRHSSFLVINLRSWYNTCVPIRSCHLPSQKPQQIYLNSYSENSALNVISGKELNNRSVDAKIEKDVETNDDGSGAGIYNCVDTSQQTSINTNEKNQIISLIVEEMYRQLPCFKKLSLKLSVGHNDAEDVHNVMMQDQELLINIKSILDQCNYKNKDKYSYGNTISTIIMAQLSWKLACSLYCRGGFDNRTVSMVARLIQHNITNELLTDWSTKLDNMVVVSSAIGANSEQLNVIKHSMDTTIVDGVGVGFINKILGIRSNNNINYEIQFTQIDNELSNLCACQFGLIMLPNHLFLEPNDAFGLLASINYPKYSNYLHNSLNQMLEIECNEPSAIVVKIFHDSLSVNGKVISHNLPFHTSNAALNGDRFSFRVFQTVNSNMTNLELFLNIRSKDSNTTNSFKLTSLKDIQSMNANIVGNLDFNFNYIIIPFIWLNHGISVSLTKTNTPVFPCIIESGNDEIISSNANLMEKHYYDDEIDTKESNRFNKTMISTGPKNIVTYTSQCSVVKQALTVKCLCALPEFYFQHQQQHHNNVNNSMSYYDNYTGYNINCFCYQCRSTTNILESSDTSSVSLLDQELFIKGDPAKQFRLPLGWVKFNIRMKKENRSYLSMWHLAYLTVPFGFIHKLLATTNPLKLLHQSNQGIDLGQLHMSWLQADDKQLSNEEIGRLSGLSPAYSRNKNSTSVIVSPWQPLNNWRLTNDDRIEKLSDAFISYFDTNNQLEAEAMVALEVRVRPNTYRSIECHSELCDNETIGKSINKEKRKSHKTQITSVKGDPSVLMSNLNITSNSNMFPSNNSAGGGVVCNSISSNSTSSSNINTNTTSSSGSNNPANIITNNTINQTTVWVLNNPSNSTDPSNDINLVISGLLVKI